MKRLNETKHRYGKCVVRVWRVNHSWNHPFPWAFSVQEDGGHEKLFAGIPNQCETKHSALMRGWYRAKWINEGTYDQHYVPMPYL